MILYQHVTAQLIQQGVDGGTGDVYVIQYSTNVIQHGTGCVHRHTKDWITIACSFKYKK